MGGEQLKDDFTVDYVLRRQRIRHERERGHIVDIATTLRGVELSGRVHIAACLLARHQHGAWMARDERIPELSENERGALAELVLRDALEELEDAETTTVGAMVGRVAHAHAEQLATFLLQVESLVTLGRVARSSAASWVDVTEMTELNQMLADVCRFASKAQ